MLKSDEFLKISNMQSNVDFYTHNKINEKCYRDLKQYPHKYYTVQHHKASILLKPKFAPNLLPTAVPNVVEKTVHARLYLLFTYHYIQQTNIKIILKALR